MIYGSVCSGIEAATVAWHPLGWRAAFYSEIEPFPCAVLNHYYQTVPNLGDMTKFKEWPDATIDLLVGGTPCQSFSVAGLRKGLDDPRGNLTLVYLAVAHQHRARWVVWENVPGVLSDGTGAFGAFLGGLAKLGYGFAYRVLDAQYAGVPQRRRRVFVVAHLGDWRRAAAVLFELHSLQGHPPPSREAREGVAPTISARTKGGGGLGTDFDCDGGLISSTGDIAHCLNAGGMGRQDYETETMVALPLTSRVDRGGAHREAEGNNLVVSHALRADGFDASEDGTGRGTPLVVDTLTSNGDAHSGYRDEKGLVVGPAVRRLTPRECERLQGFPDDYTLIQFRGKAAADGNRYKALGNSMAVPVMRWIGERIAMVDQLQEAA